MDENLPKSVLELKIPVPSENVGKKIIMFGTPTCPDCARVKKFFAENAVEYEYHDVSLEKESLKFLSTFTQSVPVLIFQDKSILYSPTDSELFEKVKGGSVNQKVSEVEPQIFDTVIIGAGPAGVSAAIYAVRKSLKVLVLTKTIGGQAALAGDVENYLGFSMISGADLASKFSEEVKRFAGEGLWIKEGVEVSNIENLGNKFLVKTTDSGEYQSKTLIIASGRTPKLLGIPGEKEFFGKGVATCATCDGPLYKGRDVVVVGGGNSALDAVFSLMKIAKSVTIVNLGEELKGDDVLLKNATSSQNVRVLNNTKTLEIFGKDFVSAIKVLDLKTNEEKEINCDGVFIEIGWVPATTFDKLTDKDEMGCIKVNEFGQSSVDGIWAAGDVNNLWGEQIIIAAGEGAKVALAVSEHISKTPHQVTSNPHEQ